MDKELSRKYFNEKASTWDATIRNNHSKQLNSMAKRIDILPDDWVLDVGTGTGIFLPYISQFVNGSGKIICIDYAINMLLLAFQKKVPADITFICSEIETLSLFSNMFDRVICYASFPHFHDKPNALQNIHRMMKPAASLYICHTASRQAINTLHLDIPGFDDHLIPDQPTMKTLLREANFSDILIQEETDSYFVTAIK